MSNTMTLLPPRKDKCQECAVDHKPELPHDACSLYYQTKFNMEHKRGATWLDAMAHCSPSVQEDWTTSLLCHGIDAKAGQVYPKTKRGKNEKA